jgi:solute carrier family 25 S-adenosylmethionine transporter 26
MNSFLLQATISDRRRLRGVDATVHSYEAAVFGSMSGGIAAAATTPLDVLKTRLMLGSV